MNPRRPAVRFDAERVTMAHGAGGRATRSLVEGLCLPRFDNELLSPLLDAAVISVSGVRLAFTTDAFVVRPLRFPGGSIGELAVHGTVNDLAVSGARPLALSAALVLEEGLDASVLAAEVDAMARAAAAASVVIATGDTKVVEQGRGDGMYVVTSGIGQVVAEQPLLPGRVSVGDRVLVSGPVGDHGVAVLLARGDLAIAADVRSDTASLWPLVEALLGACGGGLRCLRDPTRGGLATALNEIAADAGAGVVLDEAAVPVRPEVRGACELLGIDPLYVANEGCLVAFVAPDAAGAALDAARSAPGGAHAALVGEVTADRPGQVLGRTALGGHRVIDVLAGDPLPRIC